MSHAAERLTVTQAMQRAAAAYESGDAASAEQLCQAVLAADPRHVDALNLLGALLLRRGDPQTALAQFTRAIELAPGFAEGHNNLGAALNQLGRWQEALQAFKRAMDRRPGYVDAMFNKGLVYARLRQWNEAIAAYRRVLALDSSHAGAHNNLGNALLQLRRWDEALRHYERAIAARPAYAEAFCNRIVAFKELGKFDAALESSAQALALRPEYAEALNFRGTVHHDLFQWEEALRCYRQAVSLRQNYAEPHLNQGVLHLLLGDFARGLPLHEWRWKAEDGPRMPELASPQWSGRESLAGKTILLHAEQGYGDAIHYCRYATMVRALGARVVFSVAPALAGLLQSISDEIEVVPIGAALPAFDFHCPLMSLPLAFATRVESIPPPAKLRIAQAKREEWRERLGPRERQRIGVAWRGNTAHKHDHNRSIALERLAPLLAMPLELHCLQKDLDDADRTALARFPKIKVWTDELRGFDDTAALIDTLDLVICVDTSVAHLAATLGKPTWILLPLLPDHRWLLDRADSPWYPSARLFRQRARGDWDAVIEEVRAALP